MGRDKAWLPLDGEPLLNRAVALIAPHVRRVVVAAAPDQSLPRLEADVEIVRDPPIASRCGLLGLHTGLSVLTESDLALVWTCDCPFVHDRLIEGLFAALESAEAAVPRIGQQPQPLTAAYHVGPARRAAATLLAMGAAPAGSLCNQLDTRWIDDEELLRLDPRGLGLCNVNTPDDYTGALRKFAAMQPRSDG